MCCRLIKSWDTDKVIVIQYTQSKAWKQSTKLNIWYTQKNINSEESPCHFLIVINTLWSVATKVSDRKELAIVYASKVADWMATVRQFYQFNYKPTLWKWLFPSKTMPFVYESAHWLLMKHCHQQIIALIVHIMHCLSLLLCQELPKPGIPSDQYPKSQHCKFRRSHCA